MALEVTGMTRSFTFKKGSGMVMLDDPNPSDSPEMVMSYYSNFYPELTRQRYTDRSSRTTKPCTSSRPPSGPKDRKHEEGTKEKNNKKRKPCVPLDEQQSRQLARLIIGQTRRNVRYGVNREERIAAPSGAVILSKHSLHTAGTE